MSEQAETQTDSESGPLEPRELEQALKDCLRPLRNDSDTWGCASALLILAGSTFLLARILISPWFWGPLSLVLGVVLLVIWSTRDDRRKRALIDRCTQCLEQQGLLNPDNRGETIAQMRQMAANGQHSFKTAAATMLNELNEGAATPAEGPEQAVEQALQSLDGEPQRSAEPIVSRGAARGRGREQRQGRGWDRNRQIPLEPEDQEDP